MVCGNSNGYLWVGFHLQMPTADSRPIQKVTVKIAEDSVGLTATLVGYDVIKKGGIPTSRAILDRHTQGHCL
jgi:hypothetical protein